MKYEHNIRSSERLDPYDDIPILLTDMRNLRSDELGVRLFRWFVYRLERFLRWAKEQPWA